MMDYTHKFKVGQTVDLVQSTFRSAAKGAYQIVSLRPAEDGSTRYRIKSKSEFPRAGGLRKRLGSTAETLNRSWTTAPSRQPVTITHRGE